MLKSRLSDLALRAAMFVVLLVCCLNTSDAGDLRQPLKFSLIDQKGVAFTEVNLTERPSIIHFGFTNCPVVCPTTLYEVAERMRELGALAEQLQFVFVTVDPARDTPEFLKTYIDNFDARMIALTGDEREIAHLAASVGAAYRRVDGRNGEYGFDHAVSAFVLRPNSRSVEEIYMGYDSKPAEVAKRLRDLAASAEPAQRGFPVFSATVGAASRVP